MVMKVAIVHSVQTCDIEHMVEDLHAVLRSYYDLSQNRLDNAGCMQAICCILATGSECPLKSCVSLERTSFRRGLAALFVHGLRHPNAGKRLLRGDY